MADDVTRLLVRWSEGDKGALEELILDDGRAIYGRRLRVDD